MRLQRLISILGLCTVCAAVSQAQSDVRTTNINVGVIIAEANTPATKSFPANPTPFVWLNLDTDTKVKPQSWTFVNPHPISSVTPSVGARWRDYTGTTVPADGIPVQTKREAPYWEVQLNKIRAEDLADYDLLLLSAHYQISLRPLERERLRRFVDQGGVLWIDLADTVAIDTVNNLPLALKVQTPGSASAYLNLTHPLINTPYPLSPLSVWSMQPGGSQGLTGLTSADVSSLDAIVNPLLTQFDQFNIVAQDVDGPTIVVGKIGDGYIVVTARQVASALNRVRTLAGYDPNVGYYAVVNDPTIPPIPALDRPGASAARFVVNMLSLNSSYAQTGQGSRKTSSSPADIGAPLLELFDTSDPADTYLYTAEDVPAIYKGLVAVTESDVLRVYDTRPGRDLDLDGNPDDGIQDYALGETRDLLWEWSGATGLSSPIFFEVKGDATDANNPINRLAVLDQDSNLYVFDAFNKGGTQFIALSGAGAPVATITPPSADDAGNARGLTPTFHEGIIYVVDQTSSTSGRVWLVDGLSLARINSVSGDWAIQGTRPISTSPTVGYIPIQDASEGVDKVLYIPNAPSVSPPLVCGLSSLWLGARGEQPISAPVVDTGILRVQTRASQDLLPIYLPAAPSALGVKLTVLDSSGVPLTDTQMSTIFDGTVVQGGTPGVLEFGLSGAWDTSYAVRVDYNIDWGNIPVGGGKVVRGILTFADQNIERSVKGPLALGPDGMLFASIGPIPGSLTDFGGALYALKESGRGTFDLKYRWELFPQHSISLSQVNPVTYPATFVDESYLGSVLGTSSLTGMQMIGGPAVRNGMVYVTAAATGGTLPCTILMAFDAQPSGAEIRTGDLGETFSIVQPDFGNTDSDNRFNPDTFSTLTSAHFSYDRDRGLVTFGSLMTNQNGAMTQALSVSQPVIIRRSGQPDKLLQPEESGSRWNPLRWYTVLQGLSGASTPLVAGDTLYVSGTSVLADALDGGSTGARGHIIAMDANIGSDDTFAKNISGRAWLTQIQRAKTVGLNFEANPRFRFPQAVGTTSISEFADAMRIGNLDDGLAYGIVGGDDIVATWSSSSMFGLDRAEFIVADEGRLGRYDAAGNTIWSLTSTTSSGARRDVGTIGTVKPLVKPTRAYEISTNQYLVVDTGGNRVMQIDSTGREIRSISSFIVDPGVTVEGYQPNESTSLNGPKDATIYATYQANPSDFVNAVANEYWVHYLIADQGNNRMIEVVDRYAADNVGNVLGVIRDGNSNPQLGVLIWHSPASLSGKNFDYSSVQRMQVGADAFFVGGVGGSNPTSTGLTAATDPQYSSTGSGGVVVFVNDQTNIVINRAYLYDGLGNPIQPPITFSGVKSVTARYLNNIPDYDDAPRFAVMVTCSEGVFELFQPDLGNSELWYISWMLPRSSYLALRSDPSVNPKDFVPTYARRLDSGDVLIVNGYAGAVEDNSAEFNGEVVVVDGVIPASPSLKAVLRNISDGRGIKLPVFSDRR